MAANDWKTFLIPYNQAVEELKVKLKSVRTEYRKRNEYSPVEFITGRVKEISSMLEKANKFNIPHDRLRYELEDIAGIRVMCQFVDDIEVVVGILRGRRDMQIMYEKDYVSNVKPSGYRSYHIIIKYPVHMADGVTEIIAEIQIRTLAMNFWAVTEHSLNYKYKQMIPEHIKETLKTAAESAYQLDQVMLDIKDEIKDAQQLFEVKSQLISTIMRDIIILMSMNRSQEASRFQVALNKLIEYGDVPELNDLHEQVRKEIERYRH